MNQPCGCCSGVEIITPVAQINPPGLAAIAYRVGTYATFYETMLARLSNLYLDIPSTGGTGLDRIYPLAQLTTRDPADPAIALLDAWAVVADVLTFYQERIANEGYLPTAVERRSILELARLVGYRLRPGVSASVYLAFTVSAGFDGDIPAGTRAQSIPGTGERPQFFETSDVLAARDTWNGLKARLTRPQVITPARANVEQAPLVTDVEFLDTVYLDGLSTNLKTGDALLFVLGTGQQTLRMVASVDAQADQKRTEVALAQTFAGRQPVDIIRLLIDKAAFLFPGNGLAQDIAAILANLLGNVRSPAAGGADLVRQAALQIQEKQDLAAKRNFTRLEAWIADVLLALRYVAGAISGSGKNGGTLTLLPATLAASPLANLFAIATPLARPQTVQPASALRLARSAAQSFAPQSDMAPRLIAALNPAVASTLYQAWSHIETPAHRVEVLAARVKATLFAGNFAGPASVTVGSTKSTTSFDTALSISNTWLSLLASAANAAPTAVALDAIYDHIQPGSRVAIDRPAVDSKSQPTGGRIISYHTVQTVRSSNLDTGMGFAAKVTLLTLDPQWLADENAADLTSTLRATAVLRDTMVYAQAEPLDLAEEPLDSDVGSDTIDLDDVYDGLEPGRWIIVSGNRTDIANVSGVAANELAMIAGVSQGSQAPLCADAPDFIPFSQIYYTTSANAYGDRLVVGAPADGVLETLMQLPLPLMANQQYCGQVQLAPGFYANAYVPTDAEILGNFPDFAGLLAEPVGIRTGRLAWRISSQKLHTSLKLASTLAYTYDAGSVVIYANVAKATHGQTVGEVLGDGDASKAFQTFALRQSPLTYVSAPTPDGAQSTLVTRVNEIAWHETDDLSGAGPRDRNYLTRTDDADTTTVVFGNGQHGARVPTGIANVKAIYRYGIGAPGNVAAGQISQLATHPLGLQGVINPLRASGGADRDSPDQARRNTPMAVLALDRLVSVQDYADFSRTYAGIDKASAARLSDGRRTIVHVTVAGVDDIPIDQNSDLYRNLVTSLETFGDPHLPIQLCVRKVKLLVVSAGVRILADYAWESVEPKLRAALLGHFGFAARDLGQTAFLSEAVSVMQRVDGVDYVDIQVFDSVPEDVTAQALASLGATLSLNQYVLANGARLNPSPDPSSAGDPCRQVLPAELVFITPDIPDTLILTEVDR